MPMESPNLSYIDTLAGSDAAFRAQLIGIVKDELPTEVSHYQQCMETEDWKQAAEAVHKLKHKISILGLEKSYYLAMEYEESLLQADTADREQFDDLLARMLDFVSAL